MTTWTIELTIALDFCARSPGVLSLIEGTLKKLGVSKTKAVPNKLMLLVSTLNTESTRQAFAAHVMSRFKPAGLFLSEQAMVEPFIAGSVQNGMQSLVVEFGLTATATPIYKANNLLYSFPAAIKFTDIVAADLDKYIAKQLRVTLDQAEQLKIMPGVFFAAVPDAAAVKGKTKPVTRKLKNGTQITIPGDLRWTAVEVRARLGNNKQPLFPSITLILYNISICRECLNHRSLAKADPDLQTLLPPPWPTRPPGSSRTPLPCLSLSAAAVLCSNTFPIACVLRSRNWLRGMPTRQSRPQRDQQCSRLQDAQRPRTWGLVHLDVRNTA